MVTGSNPVALIMKKYHMIVDKSNDPFYSCTLLTEGYSCVSTNKKCLQQTLNIVKKRYKQIYEIKGLRIITVKEDL